MFVRNVSPVEYVYKSDESKSKRYGFIAQEIAQIEPSLVTEHSGQTQDGVQDYLTLNYIDMIALLTKQVQELTVKVESLSQELEEIKRRE
jgi:hypothetical protein